MLSLNFYDVLNYILLYLFFYNLILIILFILIWSSSAVLVKTINNFKEFNNNTYKRYTFIILLFSIAGIPPFVGFFFKLNLIAIVSLSSFLLLWILFFFFFAILFFYLQNIKYLLIPINFESYVLSLNDLKYSTFFLLFVGINLFFICFGFLLLDDFIIYLNWLIS
jgi:NADH:ubiquinone oxidoreductase subunit 2 (subunit N)